MKKIIIQFIMALLGAFAGGVAFGLLWKHIDRFFGEVFGIVIQCDGCHTEALSLLCGFIPVSAALCAAAGTRLFYREGRFSQLLWSLAGSIFLGGALSMAAVQIASGYTAAMLVASSVAAAATGGLFLGTRKLRHLAASGKQACSYENR